FFFFSSRRRHTRFSRDWSSDVCSSDLLPVYASLFDFVGVLVRELPDQPGGYTLFNLARYAVALLVMMPATAFAGAALPLLTAIRSEERRVGKEGRSRWGAGDSKKEAAD